MDDNEPTLMEIIEWLHEKAMQCPVYSSDRAKYLFIATRLILLNRTAPLKYKLLVKSSRELSAHNPREHERS